VTTCTVGFSAPRPSRETYIRFGVPPRIPVTNEGLWGFPSNNGRILVLAIASWVGGSSNIHEKKITNKKQGV